MRSWGLSHLLLTSPLMAGSLHHTIARGQPCGHAHSTLPADHKTTQGPSSCLPDKCTRLEPTGDPSGTPDTRGQSPKCHDLTPACSPVGHITACGERHGSARHLETHAACCRSPAVQESCMLAGPKRYHSRAVIHCTEHFHMQSVHI